MRPPIEHLVFPCFEPTMNPLQRALIEKAGHDNGFENVLPSGGPGVELGSARHPAKVSVTASGGGFWGAVQSGSATLAQELSRSFPLSGVPAQGFALATEAVLARWLRRAAALSQALPNQAVVAFEAQLQHALAASPQLPPRPPKSNAWCASGWGSRRTGRPCWITGAEPAQ